MKQWFKYSERTIEKRGSVAKLTRLWTSRTVSLGVTLISRSGTPSLNLTVNDFVLMILALRVVDEEEDGAVVAELELEPLSLLTSRARRFPLALSLSGRGVSAIDRKEAEVGVCPRKESSIWFERGMASCYVSRASGCVPRPSRFNIRPQRFKHQTSCHSTAFHLKPLGPKA